MTMFDEIASAWRDEVAAGGARHRRINNHSLHLYYGASETSKPVFFLITEVEPRFPSLADVISVEQGRRDDGRWTVVLTLQRRALTEAFMGMCVELARRSAAVNDPATARVVFFETLDHWKALLAGNAPRRMSEPQIRGLVAELWFALRILGATMPLASALLAWQGPYGAPQDFQTADGSMFEVKSVHSGSRTVEISSADQLDPSAEGPLTLSLVGVDNVPAGTAGSHTLVSMVAEFQRRLGHDSDHLEELEHRLLALALDLTDGYYLGRHYSVSGPRNYLVEEGFPRVLRKSVPLAADNLTYRLRIEGFEAFKAGPAQ